MKTTKTKTVKVTDKIYCDGCGECCSKQCDHEYAELSATWGYDSNQDGTQYDIQICENCFNETIEFLKKKRQRNLGCFDYPFDQDPLMGRSYFPS